VNETLNSRKVVLQWESDTARFEQLLFKGYMARKMKSEVTGLDRLYYDRSAPWERTIRYYNHFKPAIEVEVPQYYILPYAWEEVADRLKNSGVKMKKLSKDTSLMVEVSYIEDYKTSSSPYNGRYLHSDVKIKTGKQLVQFHEGDRVIKVHQPGLEYIVQTLDPRGPDSFFAWNFFDGILSRKEYFSDYLFEDTASALLKSDPELKKGFEEKKASDPAFAGNSWAQLNYIYERSPWAEKTFRRYPVVAISEDVKLPLK
jgi:hypothetical protein